MTEDMSYPTGMELHGSKWRGKKRVPKDLAAHYSAGFLYFPTGEVDKKAAAIKIRRWQADLEEEFERARKTGSRFKCAISDAEADHLCALFLTSRLSADEEMRDLGDIDSWAHTDAVGGYPRRSSY